MSQKQKLARPELTEIVLTMVKNERVRQDTKFGIQSHSGEQWKNILNQCLMNVENSRLNQSLDASHIEELIQAAAVIVAWVEQEYHRIEEETQPSMSVNLQNDVKPSQ